VPLGAASVQPGAFAMSSYNNLGTVLDQLGRLPEAIQAYHTALKLIEPGDAAEPSVLANLYNSLQAVCDWEGTAELERRLLRLVEAAMGSEGESPAGVEPFHSISYPFPAALALRIARIHARMQTPADASRPFFALAALVPSARDPAPRALRVGYLVDSLSNGTISQYLASLLASHDRNTVKTFVYLSQEARPAAVQLVEALDAQSFALRHLARVLSSGSARGAAEAASNILSSDAIHVLLDFSESGGGARHSVLAFRPAPVQVSVGFKSTQGAKYVHYALSDQVMVPPGKRRSGCASRTGQDSSCDA
jgi:predicted O-linked N-acetylglucosamine transferase (SPINDLY family)